MERKDATRTQGTQPEHEDLTTIRRDAASARRTSTCLCLRLAPLLPCVPSGAGDVVPRGVDVGSPPADRAAYSVERGCGAGWQRGDGTVLQTKQRMSLHVWHWKQQSRQSLCLLDAHANNCSRFVGVPQLPHDALHVLHFCSPHVRQRRRPHVGQCISQSAQTLWSLSQVLSATFCAP